jgi:four helix bundle protein
LFNKEYMEGNILHDKSFDFAVRIVEIYKVLVARKNEKVLSKQLLRSGTSIGANVAESQGGHSRRDFLNKLEIAYKEAHETKYWIRLLSRTGYLEKPEADSLGADCEELCRIIGKIRSTVRNSLS